LHFLGDTPIIPVGLHPETQMGPVFPQKGSSMAVFRYSTGSTSAARSRTPGLRTVTVPGPTSLA
jgi:hypothetical protein